MELISISQVAKQLEVPYKQVYDMIRNHGMPYYRINSTYRFDRSEVIQWMQELIKKREAENNASSRYFKKA